MASKNKKRSNTGPKTTESLAPTRVKMMFSTNQFYNDLDVPLYRPGVVYEIEGADKIQRWLKRGGVIVEGELPLPAPEPVDPSKIVGQGGEQTGDSDPVTGETGLEADQGKADGQKPDADQIEETEEEKEESTETDDL